MPRSLSLTAVQSINAQNTGEVWLIRLTVDHPNLAEPVRVVANVEEHDDADGNTYQPFGFDAQLPDSVPGELARVRLSVRNVDRLIVSTLRGLPDSPPPEVTLEVVLASSPETVEVGPLRYTLWEGEYDAQTVEGDLRLNDHLNQMAGVLMTPSNGFAGVLG